jgi:hypothetical protein
MKGGTIYVKRTDDDKINNSIYQILKHATDISLFGQNSVQGLNLKITIPEEKSRLIGSSISDLGRPKTQFLIKLILCVDIDPAYHDIYENYKLIYWNMNTTNQREYQGKLASYYGDFYGELQVQQDIFVKSSYLGNPLCPAIITGGIYRNVRRDPTNESYQNLYDALLNTAVRLKNTYLQLILKKINTIIRRPVFSFYHDRYERYDIPIHELGLGIICMELLNDYVVLSDYIHHKPHYTYYTFSHTIYNLVRLLSIGYYHGDLHLGNIMYSPIHDKCLFIDFGRTKRISTEINYVNEVHNFFMNSLKHGTFVIRNTSPQDKTQILQTLFSYILYYYSQRTTDENYMLHNHIIFTRENIFLNLPPYNPSTTHVAGDTYDQLAPFFYRIYINREAQIKNLYDTGSFRSLLHLKKLKNNVFDIYGKLSGLKFRPPKVKNNQETNVEMDIEVLMFFNNHITQYLAITDPPTLREMNNTKLPTFYKTLLTTIKNRELKRRTRRRKPRR